MKKFSFQFQYLLDAHVAREQAAEHALHVAVKNQALARRELRQIIQTRVQQVDVLEQMQGVVKRADYALYLRSIDTIQRELTEIGEKVDELAGEVERCREKLREEMTARCILEKLRDRAREEWAEAAQIEEQKQMDELAVGRWNRLARDV